MTDDDKIVSALRDRLREVAALVDRAAPAPPRPGSAVSSLGSVPIARVTGGGRRHSALRMGLGAAAVVVLSAAIVFSWNLRQNGLATATSSASPGTSLSSEPSKPNVSPTANSPSPTAGTGWPINAPCGADAGTCLFAPDGSLYIAPPGRGGQITAYGPSGHLRSGWPVDAPTGANYNGAVGQGWEIAPDGSLLVTTPTGITDIEQSGQVRPGWPVALADGNSQILVESSGTIIVVRDNPTAETWVYALAMTGGSPVLWSTRVTGDVFDATVAPDGTIFLAGAVHSDSSNGTRFAVSTLGSDGKLISGWSTSSWSAMAATPSGDLAVVAYDTKVTTTGMEEYNVLRTHVAVLDHSGKALPGWPRVIDGPASAPTVGPDGALYFVLGDTVATGSVLALDASGNVEPGWPISLSAGYAGVPGDQSAGHLNVSQPAIVANGLVYVAASSHVTGGQMISAFKTSGSDHTGWAYQVPSESRFTGSMYVPAVASPTGALYVLEQATPSTGAVVALGTDGKILAGWPYVFDPGPSGLTVLADGDVGIYSLDFAARLTASGSLAP